MSFQLKPVADLQKEFTITKVAGIPEIDDDNPVCVSFRQASEGDNRKRESFTSVPVTRTWTDESDYALDKIQFKTVGERRAYEIYLTLTGCDILASDGKDLIEFIKVNGVTKVKGKFDSFKDRWGQLPPALALAIHEKCIEANPTWGFGWLSKDEAEGEE